MFQSFAAFRRTAQNLTLIVLSTRNAADENHVVVDGADRESFDNEESYNSNNANYDEGNENEEYFEEDDLEYTNETNYRKSERMRSTLSMFFL